jgi:hypothetical protein
VTGTVARLLQFASVAVCLIVVASFGVFAVDQAKGASSSQQEALATGTPGAAGAKSSGSTRAVAHHESGVHGVLDEASNSLTSPFAGLVSGAGEWASRSIRLALALALYGFGIGYLIRVLRVRT